MEKAPVSWALFDHQRLHWQLKLSLGGMGWLGRCGAPGAHPRAVMSPATTRQGGYVARHHPLAKPLATPRLKRFSLSSLEPHSERVSFTGSVSLAVPFAMPGYKQCFLSSPELRSEYRCPSLQPCLFLGRQRSCFSYFEPRSEAHFRSL